MIIENNLIETKKSPKKYINNSNKHKLRNFEIKLGEKIANHPKHLEHFKKNTYPTNNSNPTNHKNRNIPEFIQNSKVNANAARIDEVSNNKNCLIIKSKKYKNINKEFNIDYKNNLKIEKSKIIDNSNKHSHKIPKSNVIRNKYNKKDKSSDFKKIKFFINPSLYNRIDKLYYPELVHNKSHYFFKLPAEDNYICNLSLNNLDINKVKFCKK